MKSEFELYMATGILGGYVPGRVIGFQEGGKIMPIYRDASCWETGDGTELHREMIVCDRRFIIHSILSSAETARTPTEQMLEIIDNDLGKGSI